MKCGEWPCPARLRPRGTGGVASLLGVLLVCGTCTLRLGACATDLPNARVVPDIMLGIGARQRDSIEKKGGPADSTGPPETAMNAALTCCKEERGAAPSSVLDPSTLDRNVEGRPTQTGRPLTVDFPPQNSLLTSTAIRKDSHVREVSREDVAAGRQCHDKTPQSRNTVLSRISPRSRRTAVPHDTCISGTARTTLRRRVSP
jgi:hypothetical protein